ncbi:Uncharacterized protein dnl_16900 [Desulfonema limicola]|uniref:Uncharacterized protein n=1 Tax=Desulfonema limicola TaxID=45656 RepID=A0A975B5Y5_9BACT|nr:Uncharacterized protein dnl_16900 [Desulfonema limicola]
MKPLFQIVNIKYIKNHLFKMQYGNILTRKLKGVSGVA